MTEKRPLVLWSGGMDSTYMLTELLHKGDVDTLYIDCGQGKEKVKKEHIARYKIRKVFREWTADGYWRGRILEDYQVRIPDVFNDIHYRRKFAQPPAWLIGATMRFNPDIHSELYIGYVYGDSILYDIEHVRGMWCHLYKLTHFGDVPNVNFRLLDQGMEKIDILQNLYPKLRDKVWVCELPIWSDSLETHKACGECHACIVLKKAMFEYKIKYGMDYTKATLLEYSSGSSKYIIQESVPSETMESIDLQDVS